jgi:signal transduction histidine kinase
MYNLDAMQAESNVDAQLKEAAQLTGAAWAALAERVGGTWNINANYRLTKSAQAELNDVLSRPSVDAWLCGALSGGHTRSGSLPAESKLGVERFFAFPVAGTSQAILVGASQQPNDAQRIWRLTASLFADHKAGKIQSFFPDLQTGLAYDLPLALDRILGAFVQTVPCQGAWLAIRRGESLDIQAEWNDPKGKALSLPIDSNPILRRINRTLSDIVITREKNGWNDIPHAVLKSGTKTWVCLPFVIGQRLIGAVALWRQKEFTPEEWHTLRELATNTASAVDVVVTFSEMAAHLRRLAMLNDFALTVSSAQNLDQIARRVFGLLARAFGTELIGLYLLSSDRQLLRDYRTSEGKVTAQSIALNQHPIQPILREGRLIRVGDLSSSEVKPINEGSRSALFVPLKYRGQTIGLLSIESPKIEAFSQYDEHLIVVIASHLAGLVEYGRLREEAEGRARSLGLIHEVVEQVIGLTDKNEVAQITADLLAQFFEYELAAVILLGDERKLSVQAFGGERSEVVKRALAGGDFLAEDGITGRVMSTGESMLVNDTGADRYYKALKGWDAGSVICVPLKDGDRVTGIIDIESADHNAFTPNDLMAIESLAGILATVLSSADQYQRLQELVHQLRATETELKARMEAQQEAESRLIQAAKLAAVGEMAAGVAHELNNPLTTVMGFTELVLGELPAESPYQKELGMVLREARRASEVVRRLLDFSRQGERVRARANLNEIVDDVIALTRHLIHTNGVSLALFLANDLPWVSVDRNQMKQVLLNLVHNALQAMPSGGELCIRTVSQKRDGMDWVTLSVQDSGVGIQPQDKEKIFEPFFTTKADRGGTGLGLSVTYSIVADHGGFIEVESEAKKGSVFTVWLPI